MSQLFYRPAPVIPLTRFHLVRSGISPNPARKIPYVPDDPHPEEKAIPTWAGKFLDLWCFQTMRSRIEPMKKIARPLRTHRELLLNYFKARKQFSSGVIEGLNNKAKVTMRKSCGFRTFRILELALYHSLGKLPEPEPTHEFF
jgi:hypothetical protein